MVGVTSTNAAIYTRISNDPTGQRAGVRRQLKDCRAKAVQLGWHVVEPPFDDNDQSAYNGTRPGFERLLAAVRAGRVDAIICWHPDRLYRRMADLQRLVEITDRGVQIATVNAGDLDLSNATGKMLGRIIASVAEMEVEHKSERQRRANIQRAEAGSWWSSQRCFGYTAKGKIAKREANLIRRAAADVLDGKSLRAIAREWNAAGICSTRGAAWNTSRLKRLLCNPRYAGLRTYRGKVTGPGKWTAIIDPETHAGLLAILRDAARGGAVSYERKYIGSHRYICGRCGAPMAHTVSTHADGRTFSRYTCTAAAHLSRSQPELDAYVESVVLAYLADQKKLHKILAERRDAIDTDDLRTRRAALAAQKDELAAMFTDGVLDGPAVRRESGKLSAKIAAIDTALAEAARRNPVADLVKDGPETVEKHWAALTPDLKGKIIDEVCTVTVNPSPRGRYFKPERIDIQPKQPLRRRQEAS
jgi:DNA invertase Pin-like site-specific DNA recombinase